MKVLTFSSLYPNAARHTQGNFLENRLRLLAAGASQPRYQRRWRQALPGLGMAIDAFLPFQFERRAARAIAKRQAFLIDAHQSLIDLFEHIVAENTHGELRAADAS